MSVTIRLSSDSHDLVLELEDGELAWSISEATPFDSRISTWGDEIYFPVPIETEPGELTTELEVGDVAFWHEGQSLAVFFGPTPMSDDEKPVPADDVELIGSVAKGLSELEKLEAGHEIEVETVS